MQQFIKVKQTIFFYAVIISLVWTFLITGSSWWNTEIEKQNTIKTVKNIARANFNKDQAYRQWATSHGGVYVKPTEKTPPSPWMAHIPDRDVVTTDGEKLTLMNPAYMLREMMEDYSGLYGIKGRIVGVVYLNKNNKADKWEEESIHQFEKGLAERMEFTTIEGEIFLRLMKPMVMNQKCQKCHGHLGFPNGSIRGGVSVSVPLKSYKESEKESIQYIQMTYFIIWILGMIAIIIMTVLAQRYQSRREKDLEELVISSQVFNNTLDAIFITNQNGKILRVNKAFSDLTGYTKEEVIGENPRILKSSHHDSEFYKNLWQKLLEDGNTQTEVWNRNKNGEVFVSIESITSLKDEKNNIKYFIATLHDITARKDAEERVIHMAHYDPLTDLPNRVLFQDRFNHAITLAQREKTKVVLAFIDIDGFKKVNDTKGHPMGDKLLIEIAKIINSCIRESDTLTRLGGDEFTIVFEHINKVDMIIPICKKILTEIKKEIIIDNQSIFVTASIGISIYPENGKDIHTLLQHADTAMYKAKDEGKNRFNFYEESMTIKAKEKVELENSLQTALKNKEFVVYYQPKISIKDNKLVGMEALVRWISPKKGLIPPDSFIPLAEEMHLIDEIDLYVLETVCKDMDSWKEVGYDNIKVAVNLSGYDIQSKNLFDRVIDIVNRYNVKPKNIEFEITETYFVNFSAENLQQLNQFKDYGFVLSIDDFGTGYSSLGNLQKLPIDILKIDQSFIRDMNENSDNQKLVDMIITLAKTLNLYTIAEGVETNYQLEYLKSKECDFMQGYLESKPIPKDEFIEYIKNR